MYFDKMLVISLIFCSGKEIDDDQSIKWSEGSKRMNANADIQEEAKQKQLEAFFSFVTKGGKRLITLA